MQMAMLRWRPGRQSLEMHRSMLLVEIEKPENEALLAWLSELRGWFDANHCAPSVFARSGRRIDRLIYRLSFDDAAAARLFSETFARYAPTIRRANPFERDQLRAMFPSPENAAS